MEIKCKKIAFLIVLMLVFASCAKKEIVLPTRSEDITEPTKRIEVEEVIPTPTPQKMTEDYVDEFFEYAKLLQFDNIRTMSENSEDVTEEYGEVYEEAFKAIFAQYAAKLEYEIISIEDSGDLSTAKVKCKYIDSSDYLAGVISLSITNSIAKTFKGEISSPEEYVEVAVNAMYEKAQELGNKFDEREIELVFKRTEDGVKLCDLSEDAKAVITMNFTQSGAGLINYWE